MLASTTALCLTLFATSYASAQGYCNNVTGTGLNLGCAETVFPGGFSPVTSNYVNGVIGNFEGLVFDSDTVANRTVRQGLETRRNIDFTRELFFSGFENVYIGSSRTDGGKTQIGYVAVPEPSRPIPDLNAFLLFDRLTLENTELTIRDYLDTTGAFPRSGEITRLFLGSGAEGKGRSGGLTLRNASLIFEDSTGFDMNSPDGTPAFIRAERGINELRLGSNSIIAVPLHVDVSDGARLDFVGMELRPFFDSWLTVGQGAELQLRSNAVLDVTKPNGSSIPSSEITGGTVRLEGSGTELRLTDPRVTDGSIIMNTGATFRVQDSNNAASTLTFVGNSNLRFDSATASLTGSVSVPDNLTVNVGAGTTVVSSATQMDVNAGLRASSIAVDQGTLDISELFARTDFYDNFSTLSVTNGGTFLGRRSVSYTGLTALSVDGGTLRSASDFGALTGGDDGSRFSLNNATLDVMNSPQPTATGIDPGLTSITLEANRLEFTGDNKVLVGISPSGECFAPGGSCIPGTTRYAGELRTNVGNGPNPSLSGFDTVLFVPFATDPTATTADYVAGGNSGVYRVATHNFRRLSGPGQPYDARPRTPTASDLAAAGSTIPANLLYTIVNDPVADELVNIAFVDVGLTNNPLVTPIYTPQTTTSVVTNPTNGNQTTTTIVTTPTNGGATQTVTTTITAPGGGVISTNTITNTLGPATGTTNTQSLGQLVSNSGGSLPFNALPQIETLHPEAYASFMTVALEQSDLRRNMVLSNANGRASGNGRIEGVTEEGRNVWFDAGLTRGQVDADGGLAGFDYDLNQFILGADVWTDNRSRVGAYLGYGTYSMTDHTTSTDTLDFSSDAFSIGAYGVMETPNWSFSGMAGVSWGDTDATRDAITGSGVNRHTASYDHTTYEIAVRAEYTSLPSRGGWHFAPEVGLGYARYEQDGFIEDGDLATALAVDDATADSLIGSVGVNLTGPSFGGGLVPLGFIRYERDFLAASDDTHDIDAAFATSPGMSQTFVGTHRGENAISIGLGLATVLNASVDASAGLVYQKNSNGDEFGGGLRITWEF